MGRKKCTFGQKDFETLMEYAYKKENTIPNSVKGVRTYDLECDYHGRITIAMTKERGNPYFMLEQARFDAITLPLLKHGLLKAEDIMSTQTT